MTTTLPARVEDYTALQAQASLNDTEKKVFKELDVHIKSRTKDNIMWYWDLGVRMTKIHNDARTTEGVYGKQLLLRLAVALGYKTDRQLRTAMDVVEAWGTKKAFTEFVKMRGEADNILQWTHIVYLAHIRDEDVRTQLAASTLNECWTAEELWAKVKQLANRTPRGTSGGPSLKIPNTAKACLTHVVSQADKFVSNAKTAWTGDAFDLNKAIKGMPADKLDDAFLEALRKAQRAIVALRTQATELEGTLNAAAADVLARRLEQERLTDNMGDDDEDDDIDDEEADDDDIDDEDDDIDDEADDDEDEDVAVDPEVATPGNPASVSIGKQRNKAARDKRAMAKVRKRKHSAV
jgi:hypothetical protein